MFEFCVCTKQQAGQMVFLERYYVICTVENVYYLLVPCNVHAMDPWFLACTTKLNLARAGALCVLLRVQPVDTTHL